jgi:hypothetical protein
MTAVGDTGGQAAHRAVGGEEAAHVTKRQMPDLTPAQPHPAAQRSEDEQSRGRTHSTQGPPQHLARPRRGSATPAEISPFPETPGVVLRLLQSGDTERPRLGHLGLLPA